MMTHKYRHLGELNQKFSQQRNAIRGRLEEFSHVPQSRYFYELVYCFLTPQTSAVNAAKAQAMLERNNFLISDFDPAPMLHQPDYYIRFHKTKSSRLAEMKKNFPDILSVVRNGQSAFHKREWLSTNVKGLSYKEATHFLRNVGLNSELAILDRHILKNLNYHGVIRAVPAALTKKRYLAIETKFQRFAREVGISVNELDLLFWSNETGEILK
ncbi:MAG: DNA lyase [Bacteroidota bacterium]|nr:DNA lyase [Bacteroidota bacterium]